MTSLQLLRGGELKSVFSRTSVVERASSVDLPSCSDEGIPITCTVALGAVVVHGSRAQLMPERNRPVEAAVHTAFSAECNHLFDWHSAALYYSHRLAGQPGPITRLLACNPPELAEYQGLGIGPTFVHPNLRNHPMIDEIGYPSYNKPGSLVFWLNSNEAPREEFIFFIDADMLLRQPINLRLLRPARGAVVSASYTYLVGTHSGFAERFIDPDVVYRQAQVGGFHIFHREDVRRISPKWLVYTKKVRAFSRDEPDIFDKESMHISEEEAQDPAIRAVRRKQGRWHSEMYGYVFAAAEEGMIHHIRKDLMLYPGYIPFLGISPTILHYGADYIIPAEIDPSFVEGPAHVNQEIKSGDFYFNKMCEAMRPPPPKTSFRRTRCTAPSRVCSSPHAMGSGRTPTLT